jgi:hypothetical protein
MPASQSPRRETHAGSAADVLHECRAKRTCAKTKDGGDVPPRPNQFADRRGSDSENCVRNVEGRERTLL